MHDVPLTNGVTVGERYRVDRVLGTGSMATVYLAHDVRLGVDRAIKIPFRDLVQLPTFAQRFTSEAQASLHLDHPNIMRVFEVGRDERLSAGFETLFVAMEFVPGGSLKDYLAERGSMAMPSAMSAIRGVLRGLQRAHGKGVLHREVKTSNILIGKGGVPKLGDFGLARLLEVPGVRELRKGEMSPFLAPEQRSGTRPPTLTADIYSAGATLYTLMTGKEPAGLDETAIRGRLLSAIDDPACEIIDRATKPQPDERFPSASEFLDALESATAILGQAAFTAEGIDHGIAERAKGSELMLTEAAGPFEAPPDLAADAADDDPPTHPGGRPPPVPDAPPIILEHAPPRSASGSSDDNYAAGSSVTDMDEPDSVDNFDVRELGLPLRSADSAPAAASADRADDIASSLRSQRVPAATPKGGVRRPEDTDPQRKLVAVVGAISVVIVIFLGVIFMRAGQAPPPASAPAAADGGPATTNGPSTAGPAAIVPMIQPVTAADPRTWKPPADPDALEDHLRAAPWM